MTYRGILVFLNLALALIILMLEVVHSYRVFFVELGTRLTVRVVAKDLFGVTAVIAGVSDIS